MPDVRAQLRARRPPLLGDNVGAADPDRGLDLAIGAHSGAQKIQGNYCTICCTIPAAGDWLAESLANSFVSTR